MAKQPKNSFQAFENIFMHENVELYSHSSSTTCSTKNNLHNLFIERDYSHQDFRRHRLQITNIRKKRNEYQL